MNQILLESKKTKFLIIGVLLTSILIVGCLSQPSSLNNPLDSDNLQKIRIFNSTNGIYSINVTVPIITGKLMTYTVEKPNYTREQVSSLAKKLGMSGEIRDTPEAFFANSSDEEKNIFTVFKNKKQISFENLSGGSSGDLNDDGAIAAVNDFVNNTDLMPTDASNIRVSGYNTGGEKSPTGQGFQDNKQIVVSLSRQLNGLPDWNSKMMVTVGSHGNVVGFFMVWPDYQSYKAVSLKSPELAFKEFQTQEKNFVGAGMPINPEKIVVTNVSLGYSTSGGKYLQPIYLFSGYGQQGDRIQKIDPLVKIPASSEPLE